MGKRNAEDVPTLRCRVKDKNATFLSSKGGEVNFVWNFRDDLAQDPRARRALLPTQRCSTCGSITGSKGQQELGVRRRKPGNLP
jgi:hypothetical protein